MKKLTAFGLLAIVLGINTGCEQQSYEETKMFNQSWRAGHGHSTGHEGEKAGENASSEHAKAEHKEAKE